MKRNNKYYTQEENKLNNVTTIGMRIKSIAHTIIAFPFQLVATLWYLINDVLINWALEQFNKYTFKRVWKWCDKYVPKMVTFNKRTDDGKIYFYLKQFETLNNNHSIIKSKRDKMFIREYQNAIYKFIADSYTISGYKKVLSTDKDFFKVTGWEYDENDKTLDSRPSYRIPRYIYFVKETE